MSPVVVNILDMIDMGGSEVIEHKLATFSSPKNPEIEDFIRNKAISFATGKLSITYLVNDGDIFNDKASVVTLRYKSIACSQHC